MDCAQADAEQLVKLHLQALTRCRDRPAQSRVFRGVCATTTRPRLPVSWPAPSGCRRRPQSVPLHAQFKSDLYEGESFVADGDQVEIGFAQPRTSSRSAWARSWRATASSSARASSAACSTRGAAAAGDGTEAEARLRRHEEVLRPRSCPACAIGRRRNRVDLEVTSTSSPTVTVNVASVTPRRRRSPCPTMESS